MRPSRFRKDTPPVAGSSRVDKGKGRADPPQVSPRNHSQRRTRASVITEDALYMCTLSALLESMRCCRDTNLQEFLNALADLCLTAESDTLVGNVFATQEEFTAWFNFVQDFVGTERVPTPEGSSRVDLEELGSRLARAESSPVAGPSSIMRRNYAIHCHRVS